jgi:hypothetical protein
VARKALEISPPFEVNGCGFDVAEYTQSWLSETSWFQMNIYVLGEVKVKKHGNSFQTGKLLLRRERPE